MLVLTVSARKSVIAICRGDGTEECLQYIGPDGHDITLSRDDGTVVRLPIEADVQISPGVTLRHFRAAGRATRRIAFEIPDGTSVILRKPT
jgi:hypothetical protein